MTGRRHRRGENPKQPKNYRVGYGRPPKEHRFKPGLSGNPKGRPKGAKNESTLLQEILGRRIEIRQDGRVRKISVLEGVILKITEDALKGNTKSAAFLLNRLRLDGSSPEREEYNTDDREIIETFLRQHLAQAGRDE